jgi:hypothetical protein
MSYPDRAHLPRSRGGQGAFQGPAPVSVSGTVLIAGEAGQDRTRRFV